MTCDVASPCSVLFTPPFRKVTKVTRLQRRQHQNRTVSPAHPPACMTHRRKGSVDPNSQKKKKNAFYFTYISRFHGNADSFYFVWPRLGDIHLRDFCCHGGTVELKEIKFVVLKAVKNCILKNIFPLFFLPFFKQENSPCILLQMNHFFVVKNG